MKFPTTEKFDSCPTNMVAVRDDPPIIQVVSTVTELRKMAKIEN
jgi:hypothetical protein